MEKKLKVRIDVFVTKSYNFRAKIHEPGKPPFSVTINGKNWNDGLGTKYEERIKKKMLHILYQLAFQIALS